MISYLQVENVTKSYGEKVLFSNISLGICKDQKIALIAKNGAGKTSLLQILAGKDLPDDGLITCKRDITIGYLEQNPEFSNDLTVIEQVFFSSSKIIQTIKNYEEALEVADKQILQAATEQMDLLEAWDYEVKIKQILSKLNINNFHQKVRELSGGQKKRLALANVLIINPDLLILDEPTNHLDMEMIEWLEEYLQKANTTLLMVTHDRYFLDKVCNEIVELENNTLFRYRGNYSYYLEKREERLEVTAATLDRAKQLYRKELDWIRRSPSARGTKAKARVENFYEIEQVAKQRIDNRQLNFDVKTSPLGKKVLDIYNIDKKYGELILLEDFTYRFNRSEKIGVVGRNGSGKTTLLNIIVGSEKLDRGRIEMGETVHLGYCQQDSMLLDKEKRVIEIIKDIAEVIQLEKGKKLSATQFLEHFLFPSEMHYTYVAKLSGGERRRLYLLTVLLTNPNFLVLDEPTNDLDIMTLNVLEEYLANFKGSVLVVSHDRYFMDKVIDTLFIFEGNGKVKVFTGNYTDYRIYIENKEKEERKIQRAAALEMERKAPPPTLPKEKKQFSYKEKREYEMLEKEISTLHAEKDEIEQTLNTSNLNPTLLTEKSIRLNDVINLIEEKEWRWLEINELMGQ